MDCGVAARASNLSNNMGLLLMEEKEVDESIVCSSCCFNSGEGEYIYRKVRTYRSVVSGWVYKAYYPVV